MIEFTRDEIWNSDYDMDIKKEELKTSRSKKLIMIGLITVISILATNVILIYNFFNLLNKI